jgi:VWFA-related protein
VVTSHIGVPQNFTADRARLRRAIAGLDVNVNSSAQDREVFDTGGGGGGGLGVFNPLWDGRCMCGACVLEGLAGIAEALRDLPGRRKVVLFVGSAVAFQIPPDTLGCSVRLRDARQRMFDALDRASVTVHSVDPSGLHNVGQVGQAASLARADLSRANLRRDIQESLEQQSSLFVLPDRTGGRTITNTNAPDLSIPAILEESGAYYLLGFPRAQDGKRHTITVKVNRRGVDVFTARRYDGSARAVKVPASLAPPATEALRTAMTSALPGGRLALDLMVAPFATTGARQGVVAITVGVPLALQSGDRVTPSPRHLTVVTSAFDRRGRPVGSATQTLTLSSLDQTKAILGTLNVVTQLGLDPGDYELRIGVMGDSEIASSVGTYVIVPNFATDPLSLSGVVLATEPETPVVPGDGLSDLLPLAPILRRTFPATDRVTAFVRVYQGIGLRTEPRAVDVRIQVRDAVDHVRVGKELTMAPDRFVATRSTDLAIDLPLRELPPGEYLLQMNAQVDQRVVGRALRFTVR